jgi:hypothetical protein
MLSFLPAMAGTQAGGEMPPCVSLTLLAWAAAGVLRRGAKKSTK